MLTFFGFAAFALFAIIAFESGVQTALKYLAGMAVCGGVVLLSFFL